MNSNDGKIDYSDYTYPELLQALNNIDRRSYPQNYANIERAIEQISPAMREAYDAEMPIFTSRSDNNVDRSEPADEPKQEDPETAYKRHVVTGTVIAVVSGFLLWSDRIPLPIAEKMTFAFSEFGETLAQAAFLIAITVPASFVINYVDHRDDKKIYRTYALIAEAAATVLLGFAFVNSLQ